MAPVRRPGVLGMLADIMEIMPMDEMMQLMREAYENNEHVRLAVEKLKGDEFRRVAEAIEEMEEFADLKENMEKVGVDVDCTVCQMKWALGWLEQECLC